MKWVKEKAGGCTDPDLLYRFCVAGDMGGDTTSEVGTCNINSRYAGERDRDGEGENEGRKEEEKSGKEEEASHDCNSGNMASR